MEKLFGRNIEQWLGNSDSISLALEFPDTDDHEIDMLLASKFQSSDVGLGSAPIINKTSPPTILRVSRGVCYNGSHSLATAANNLPNTFYSKTFNLRIHSQQLIIVINMPGTIRKYIIALRVTM